MIPRVKPGDPITARLQNQLIDSVDDGFHSRRSFTDNHTRVGSQPLAPPYPIEVLAHADINAYSIFTCEEGDEFDAVIAKVKSKQINKPQLIPL